MCKKSIYAVLFVLLFGLTQAQAQDEWIRAAYWDSRYPGAWGGGGAGMRDAVQAAGYTILNADQLKTWMNERIADKKLSVVVFCLDVAPDTVCETMDANCTLRKYLNAGGKIVWYADWPFYYQGHANGAMDTWGGAGASAVLGFDASSGPNETYEQVTFTAAGRAWGLTQAWQSRRPTSATITSNLTVLATISSGSAAAWVKHYVPGDKYRGFVRLYDTAGTPNPDDVMRLAEFMGKKASNPSPPDGATSVTQPLLSWAAGVTAASHDLYFGTNPTPGAAQFITRQPANQTVYWHQPGLVPGTTYYWRVDEVEADGTTIHTGDVWTFTAPALTAWQPKPADGAENVLADVNLRWYPGWGAMMHHVYFGENYDDVDNGTAGTDKGITTETTYAITGLRAETTYYWRVDEFNGTAWQKGPVWSFSTLLAGTGRIIRQWWLGISGTAIGNLTGNANYPDNPTGMEFVDLFEGPVDWLDNYGSRLCGWLFPPATGNYTFWIATDDQGQLWLSTDADPANKQLIASVSGWVPSRDFDGTAGDPGTNQKSAAISLEAGKAYYIEALMKEGGGGDNIAVAWQGGPITTRQVITADYVGPTGSIPLKAYSPTPRNGATDVVQTVTLSWSAGEKAAQHDVFFGTDRTAVANATTATAGIYRGRQNLAATTYVPTESPLQWDTTYYWRVDEINTADPEGPWKGNVWSFTTANFIIVEDFERYDDLCDRIFYTWTDGWGYSADPTCGVAAYGGNGTGSTVGNLGAPFAEQTIVHGGNQSMPFEYNNTGTGGKARYSETQRQWASPQDWTKNNVKVLTLWFYGAYANAAEQLYVALEDNAGHVKPVNHHDTQAVLVPAWQEWNIELSDFSAGGVNLAAVKKMYIGFGNRVSPTAGGTGKIYVDDIRVYPSRCVPSMLRPDADIAEPYDCKVGYEDLGILADEWLFQTQLHNWQERAAYWDIRYRTNWASEADSVAVRDGLAAAGYTILNADQLKTWMNARIADKKLSVVVFCRDNAPDTVVESVDATCTLRRYLDAGGKIVFYADIPFWDIAHADGTWDNPQTAGASDILGFDNTVVLWDSNTQVTLTADGIRWGLTQTWGSVRPIATTDVTVLATDAAGNAAAWVKHYLPGDTYRGFVRLYDRTGRPPVGDIIRAAESKLAADLHEDGKVNLKDFAVLADSWLDQVFWP